MGGNIRLRAGPTDTISWARAGNFYEVRRGWTYREYRSQPDFFVEGMFIVPNPQLQIGTVVSMPFEENSYIVHLTGQNDCIIFDPGFEPDAIVDYLEKHSLTPAAIVCTHGHSDHIAGNAEMKRRWPECPIVIGAGDAEKLVNPDLNLSAPFGFPMTSPPADRTLREGERFAAAALELEVLEAPGHSI